jgi:hypothetical protein
MNTFLVPWDLLATFRARLYHRVLDHRKDTLFELLDALSTGAGPVPLVHHSLSPVMHRGWASLPDALDAGTLKLTELRQVLVDYLPVAPDDGWPVWVVDGTHWPRPAAVTSPERTWEHRPSSGIPQHGLVPAWAYQWLVAVPLPGTSWTLPLDVRRRGPASGTPTALAITQLTDVLTLRPASAPRPVVTFDTGYDLPELLVASRDPAAGATYGCHGLLRLNRRRRFWLPPSPYTGRGRRPTYGRPLYLNDPATQPVPDQILALPDDAHGTLTLAVWTGIRVRPLGQYPFCLVRIQAAHLPRSTRTPEPLWLAWLEAEPPADLGALWRWYAQRFTVEHGFRFAKHDLGWTTVRLRDPDAADRWTWLVALTSWQLWLARTTGAEQRLPWEHPQTDDRRTPHRVRRGMGPILLRLGSPVRPVRPRGKAPGRHPGQHPAPHPRCPVAKRSPRAPPPTPH